MRTRDDDSALDELSKHSWHLSAKGYAATNVPGPLTRQRTVLMHRLVIAATEEQEVDHIDGNPLNNRLSNLRVVTHQQNLFNQKKKTGTVSKYKGVTWCKRSSKWLAQVMKNKRNNFLGYFVDEMEAARAYDSAARELFGQFARTNF
jgi:hypothetical protein